MVKVMESSDDNLSDEISLEEVFEKEKSENQKRITNEYARKYYQRPEVKARNTAKRQTKVHEERLQKMDQDQHIVCKKLGKSIAHSRRNPDYSFKCTRCEVSYSEKDKNQFFNKSYCPCCHFKLRIRKTIQQKRNQQ